MLERLAHGDTLRRLRGQVGQDPHGVHDRLTVAHERPQVAIERAELALHLEGASGVVDRGADLLAIADDGDLRVAEQPLDLGVAESGHNLDVEVGERLAIGLATMQNGRPAQPGLGAFEREQLKQLAVVVLRHAPLVVVVGLHERVAHGPLTPGELGHGRS
jgi:hypothetical protein